MNLSILLDRNNQKLMIKGFMYTAVLSIVAILLAIIISVLFAIIKCSRFGFGRITITGLGELFRLTPPLLHLYIIFFGIGGYLSNRFNILLDPLLVGILSFSIYTGAANSGILEAAIREYRKHNNRDSTARQVIKAVDASYENLQSNLVNLVKLAGVASVISVPEIISSSAKIVAKFGNQMLMMNILLVFYLIFIGAIIQALKYGKKGMEKWVKTV